LLQVILLDDAHHLDAGSWALVHAVARGHAVRGKGGGSGGEFEPLPILLVVAMQPFGA
jgi:hypothetical protein